MPPKEPNPHDTVIHMEKWLADHPHYQKHSGLDKTINAREREAPVPKNPSGEEAVLWNELEKVRATVRELQNEQRLLDPVHDAVAYTLVGDLIGANMVRLEELQMQLKKDGPPA